MISSRRVYRNCRVIGSVHLYRIYRGNEVLFPLCRDSSCFLFSFKVSATHAIYFPSSILYLDQWFSTFLTMRHTTSSTQFSWHTNPPTSYCTFMKNTHNIRHNLYIISRPNAAHQLKTTDLDVNKIMATWSMVTAQQLCYIH